MRSTGGDNHLVRFFPVAQLGGVLRVHPDVHAKFFQLLRRAGDIGREVSFHRRDGRRGELAPEAVRLLVQGNIMTGKSRRPCRFQACRPRSDDGNLFRLFGFFKLVLVLKSQCRIHQAPDGLVLEQHLQAALLASDAGADIFVTSLEIFFRKLWIRQR